MSISSGYITFLVRHKQSSEKEIHFYLEVLTCDPSICAKDCPKFIVSNQTEDYISTSGLENSTCQLIFTSAAGQMKILIVLEKILFFPIDVNIFVMQGKCLF